MFNGSHSRHSHPFDKRVPKMPKKELVTTDSGFSYYQGFGTGARQTIKDMHKKKQRQHDRKLAREYE